MAPRSTPDAAIPSLPEQLKPAPRRPSSGPMFLPPDPTQNPTMTAASLPDVSQPEASPSAGDESPDPSEQSDAPRTSSTGSSGADLGSKQLLAEGFRNAVLALGTIAHRFRARDEIAREHGQYLVAAEEAEAIGDPVASIVQRHGGIGAAGNPDLTDAFAVLLGLAVYALRQLDLASMIAAARANRARARAHDVDGGEQE